MLSRGVRDHPCSKASTSAVEGPLGGCAVDGWGMTAAWGATAAEGAAPCCSSCGGRDFLGRNPDSLIPFSDSSCSVLAARALMRLAWKPAAKEPGPGPLAFACLALRTPPAGACWCDLKGTFAAAATGACLRVCFLRPILRLPEVGVRGDVEQTKVEQTNESGAACWLMDIMEQPGASLHPPFGTIAASPRPPRTRRHVIHACRKHVIYPCPRLRPCTRTARHTSCTVNLHCCYQSGNPAMHACCSPSGSHKLDTRTRHS